MTKDYGIGLLAGLVSALLFALLLRASPLALLLYLLAPLPILIAGLGWSHRAALAAIVSGSVALAIGITPYLGLGFAAYLAIPAWWLAYLALLGRTHADRGLEWYPLGRLLAWVAGTAALAYVAIAVIGSPSFEAYRTQITALSRKVVQAQMQPAPGQKQGAPTPSPQSGETPPPAQEPAPETDRKPADLQEELAGALATLAPGIAAQVLTLLFTLYLWLAARIVQISGRLHRPWPDIPATAMPRAVLGLFALAVGLSLGPGYVGVLGVALTGALGAAFALQGLAAFHDRSRGRPARGALLAGLYLVLILTQGVALVALTLFGLFDTAMNRRAESRSPHP